MNMNVTLIIRIAVGSALLTGMGCTQTVVTPLPQSVRRIVVLPPHNLRGGDIANAGSDLQGLPSRTIGDLLAQQARAQLAEKGFEVLEPSVVKLATRDRVPTSPQMAAQILQEAHLDATALYIEVRRWEPNTSGMKIDGVIVALDVMMVDPKTGTALWRVHRSSRPVPLYGVLLRGQANIVVAETVMKEMFASVGSRQPNA
jgi:hypothetical protein